MKGRLGNSREKIIDAAEQVVLQEGARHLTLDAVASRSGVSRGGLLYHFPGKEALLKGMLDRLRSHMAESMARKRAGIPAGPAREAVVFVRSAFDEGNDRKKGVTAAVLASGAHDPRLLAPVREDFRRYLQDLTREGLGFERAAVIFLATNGMKFLETFSMSPFDERERRDIIAALEELAGEGASPGKETHPAGE